MLFLAGNCIIGSQFCPLNSVPTECNQPGCPPSAPIGMLYSGRSGKEKGGVLDCNGKKASELAAPSLNVLLPQATSAIRASKLVSRPHFKAFLKANSEIKADGK